jgi:uncharacterized protein YecE (DUF72 family)
MFPLISPIRPKLFMESDSHSFHSRIYVGTSGWSYKHWRGIFYPDTLPPTKYLQHFSRYFTTVEINNSFYRLPEKSSFLKWKDETPPDFLFATKASRFITHLKRLRPSFDSVTLFLDRVRFLGDKLGPILFQLPPRWKADQKRLEEFLKELPSGYQYVFEFRDHSWFTDEIYATLSKYNIAFCIYDLLGDTSPLIVTSKRFVYVRLHGSGQKYGGSYPDEVLKVWSKQILEWQAAGYKVFFYFNNDHKGFAIKNAFSLRGFLKEISGNA